MLDQRSWWQRDATTPGSVLVSAKRTVASATTTTRNQRRTAAASTANNTIVNSAATASPTVSATATAPAPPPAPTDPRGTATNTASGTASADRRGTTTTNTVTGTVPAVFAPAPASASATGTAEEQNIALALRLQQNANLGNVFTEEEEALVNNAITTVKSYSKAVLSDERELFQTVIQHSTDEHVIRLCSRVVPIDEHGFENDRLFYKELGGGDAKKTVANKMIISHIMTVYVTKVRQKKNGNEFASSSMHTKLKHIFSCFGEKRIPWTMKDFGKRGDWLSVIINTRMNKLKDTIAGYGVKNVAEIDEEADEKFLAKLEDGTIEPFHDYDDLNKCIIALLGRCLGYRGGSEIAKATWKQFTFHEATRKIPLPYLQGQPGGGWCKSHKISLANFYIRTGRPCVVDDPSNPWCLYKLMLFYRKKCDPAQERLLCQKKRYMQPNNPYRVEQNKVIGPNPVQKYAKEVAAICGYLDFERFSAHCNRRIMISNNVNQNAPLKERRDQHRHDGGEVSEDHYVETSGASKQAFQNISRVCRERDRNVDIFEGAAEQQQQQDGNANANASNGDRRGAGTQQQQQLNVGGNNNPYRADADGTQQQPQVGGNNNIAEADGTQQQPHVGTQQPHVGTQQPYVLQNNNRADADGTQQQPHEQPNPYEQQLNIGGNNNHANGTGLVYPQPQPPHDVGRNNNHADEMQQSHGDDREDELDVVQQIMDTNERLLDHYRNGYKHVKDENAKHQQEMRHAQQVYDGVFLQLQSTQNQVRVLTSARDGYRDNHTRIRIERDLWKNVAEDGKKELEIKIEELSGVKIERDDYKNKEQKAQQGGNFYKLSYEKEKKEHDELKDKYYKTKQERDELEEKKGCIIM